MALHPHRVCHPRVPGPQGIGFCRECCTLLQNMTRIMVQETDLHRRASVLWLLKRHLTKSKTSHKQARRTTPNQPSELTSDSCAICCDVLWTSRPSCSATPFPFRSRITWDLTPTGSHTPPCWPFVRDLETLWTNWVFHIGGGILT